MANAGYTTAEIAKALGVSTSTITKSIKWKE
jgi:IS30 family transposase